MQIDFNKDGKYIIVVLLLFVACIIWGSPMVSLLSLRDNDNLGKIIAVASIIALTSVHRIAGIMALVVVIAFMQNRPAMEGFELPKQKEGFTANIENSPIMTAQNWIKDNAKKAKAMTETFISSHSSFN
jgi:hypothetical protein